MSTINITINFKADQCVKCGLCLPHCPTYRLFEDENESPRGRIALFQALANQQVHADRLLRRHIDHCLGCRKCERVCPSGVDYGYLLDHSRQMLHRLQAPKGLQQQLTQTGLKLTTQKNRQRILQTGLYYYQKTGLQYLLRKSGLLKLLRLSRFDRLLPEINPWRPFKPAYPAKAAIRGRLGLFTGCTGNLFDQQTLQHSIALLQRLGYEVIVPEQQTCCGALHQHQGKIETAVQLALQNIQAFAGVDTIIYIASGCGAQLKEYPNFSWPDDEQTGRAGLFADRSREICSFLASEDLSQFHFRGLNQTVAIHTPCSLSNNLRKPDASMAILQHIPDIQLTAIPAETGCCGAAGSYMLSQATLAGRIRETSLKAINELNAQLITTTNIGCALHLNAGLPDKQSVTHPVTLLARQLDP